MRDQLRAPRLKLQKGIGSDEWQKDADERTAKIEEIRRRILKVSPSAEAEQKEDGTDMAAATKGIGWRNGTLGLRGVSGCAYKELGGSGCRGAPLPSWHRRERGGGRGPSHGGKKKEEDRAMKAIDGCHLSIPLRWRGLEPKEASPTGWAGFTGFPEEKTGAFSIKIKQPLFWSFGEQKKKK